MMPLTTITLAAALLASVSHATPTKREESVPFSLTVTSSDDSGRYNSASVAACHSGAAIEALCVYRDQRNAFTFNAAGADALTPGGTPAGSLDYTLNMSPPLTQSLNLRSDGSNVRTGFFGSGDGPASVAFDAENKLALVEDGSQLGYSWHVCPQTTLGYDFETVSYVNDGESPANTGCHPVKVTRGL